MKTKSLSMNALFSSLKTLTTLIFPLITYPYITRVLTVDSVGKINFSQSVVSYFLLFAGFGLSAFAIRSGSQIRENTTELHAFANRIFSINLITTALAVVALIILLAFPTPISNYKYFIYIQGLAVLASPFAVDWLYVIHEDFAYITIRSFAVSCISLILMFLFVKSETDVYLYVLLVVISNSFGNIFNFVHSKKYFKLGFTTRTRWTEYKSSILIFFVNSIATTIYLNSDTTLLGLMKDDYSVGIYSAAVKVYSIIKQMFNAVVASIIPRLAFLKRENEKEFEKLIAKVFQIAVFFVVPATTGIILLRKEIIYLISGNANTTLAILAIAIFFAVLANILANGLLVCLGREQLVVRATIISAVVNAGLNLVFIPLLAQNGAAITTLIAEVLMVILSLFYCKDYIKKIVDIRMLLQSIGGSCIMFAFVKLILSVLTFNNIAGKIGVVLVSSVFVYFGVMFILKNKLLLEMLNGIKRKARLD